jgi:uncharacterized RDD family membrane protein YckC
MFPIGVRGESDYYARMSQQEMAGAGSEVAGMGRRFIAITLDWLMSWAVGSLIFSQDQGRSLWIPLVFFLEIVLLTWLTGASAGQRVLGLTVRSYPGGFALTLPKVILRTLLILLVIPAVVFDSEGRGLHDRIVSSAVFRK